MKDAPHRMDSRHTRRQRGAGMVEYVLITASPLAALLTPFGGQHASVVSRLIGAIKRQHQAFLFAARVPVVPGPDGWSGGALNGSPGPVGGFGGHADNGSAGGANGGGSAVGDDSGNGQSPGAYDGLGGGPGGGLGPGPDSGSGGSGHSDNGAGGPGGNPGGAGGGTDRDGGGIAGDSGARSDGNDFDFDWSLLLKAAAVAAEFYCLITPDEVTPWTADDLAAYEASREVYQIDGQGFASKRIRYKPSEGFAASLTQTKGGQWILAFRGTQLFSMEDWIANGGQALFGRSAQYEQAIQLAQRVQKALGDEEVLLVGHSLGGGMAAAAAYATGWRAITFNAAGLHPDYRQGTPGEIRSHYIVGELLTTLQNMTPLPDAVGTPIKHTASCVRGPLQRHRIGAFEASKARWLAAQRSNSDTLASAPPSEPDTPERPSAGAATDSASGLRFFVPPAQRAANRPIETSLP